MKIYTDKRYILTGLLGFIGPLLVILIGIAVIVVGGTNPSVITGALVILGGIFFAFFLFPVYARNYFQWTVIDEKGVRVQSLAGKILFVPWREVRKVTIAALPLFAHKKKPKSAAEWFVFADGRENTDESTGMNGKYSYAKVPRNEYSEKAIAKFYKGEIRRA